MEFLDLEAAVAILGGYHPRNGDYWNVSAEHDELWLPGPPPNEMDAAHAKILEDRGWSWTPEYDSWGHYT